MPRAGAQAGGQGKIEGQLVNGTKDASASSVSGITVTLLSATMGASDILSTTTQSDASGKFVFSNLDTISTTRYLAIASYSGVEYYSDILSFPPPTTTITAAITIFETTTDPSVIVVRQTHLVFDVQSSWLAVQEIVVFENTSDRVFTGAGGTSPHTATLTLPILARAINFEFEDPSVEATTLVGSDVLTYTLPIGPGMDQIILGYAVPFTPPKYELALRIPFDTKFGIYLTDVGATIQSAQLSPQPSVGGTGGGPTFIASGAEKIAAGTEVKATFDNLPASASQPAGTTPASAAPDNTRLVSGVALGIGGLVLLGLLALLLTRRRRHAAAPAEQDARVEILQEIADLDDAFEAGKISETEYREQRTALKAELAELKE